MESLKNPKTMMIIAFILSAMITLLGATSVTRLGTTFFNAPEFIAEVVTKAPSGAEYNVGQVMKEIGLDISFMFLLNVPQIVKSIINYSDGTLYRSECSTTQDKLIYLIQGLFRNFEFPEGDFAPGHDGGI